MSNTDNRTATQRIEDLEKVVTMLYQAAADSKNAVENLLRAQGDIGLIKEALKLLNKKTEAIIQVASLESGINFDSVKTVVVKMNVEDLTAQVAGYLAAGRLAPTDEVKADSYVVCEEYKADGTLENPRIQFRMDSQQPAESEALMGKKVGDTATFGDGKFTARILELYTLTEPKAPEAPQAAPAAETTPADAPVATEAASVAAEVPTEAPASAPTAILDALPTESSPAFGLEIHGQPDPSTTPSA